MANYNVQYTMSFDDAMLTVWRIDLALKDGGALVEPYVLLGAALPLKLDKQNSQENQFEPIIKTLCTFSYIYRGGTDPAPETFINIENDQWLITVYRSGNVYWKGFMSTEFNEYPFLPTPFAVSLKATDFSFMDSKPIDLDSASLFLYDYITIGDFFKRSLFYATGYDDTILNIQYNKKPDVIGSDLITSALYMHTDAFYDFVKGAKFVSDCLKQVLSSIGARLFYTDGAYWLQYIEDIDDLPRNIITITPSDTIGTTSTSDSNGVVMGNSPGVEVVYTDRSASVLIGQPLKQQVFNYDLKAINQVKNFDWRTDTQSPFDNWEGDVTGFFTRVGAGGVADPFRLHIEYYPGPGQRSIWSRIPVLPSKLIEIDLKVKGVLTLPAPSTITYKLYLKTIVVLVAAGTIVPLKYMSSGGQWEDASGGGVGNDEYYHVEVSPNSDSFGTLNIRSEEVPFITGVPDLEVLFIILNTECDPSPPPGSIYYVELYPVFARIYNSPYVRIDETVINAKNYSLVNDDEGLFFNDTGDIGYSNTIAYDVGGIKTALPLDNWGGKTIDETVVKLRADQQGRAPYSILGTFKSNAMSLFHTVFVQDMAYKHTFLIRDAYSVKAAMHDIMVSEIMPEGTAIVTYNKLPLTKDQIK